MNSEVTVPLGDGWYQRGPIISKMEGNCLHTLDLREFMPSDEVVQADARLKNCGLVWREDQSDSHRWVEPAPTRHEGRIKTLPLFMVKPVAGLEIHALDGERYVLPKDFKGDWFLVTSPKGVALIP